MNKVITIDLMGGDYSIEEAYPGAVLFAKINPDYKVIGFALKGWNIPADKPTNLEIRFSDTFIKNDDGILTIIREKKSTLRNALDITNEGEAEAIVAATASGPYVGGAYSIFKTFNENIKPVFAAIIVGSDSKERLLLDAGAILDVDANDLITHSLLAKAVWRVLHPDITNSKVGLINIGSEYKKGDVLRQGAFKLFTERKQELGFIGNVETNDLLTSDADIFVTDAWTGNIILKTLEGAIIQIGKAIINTKKGSFLSKVGLLLARKELRKNLNPPMQKNASGGVLILGLNHIAIKAHGFSKRDDYFSAMNVAKKAIEGNVIENTRKEIITNGNS